jgi:thymidylate synthase (FAD)
MSKVQETTRIPLLDGKGFVEVLDTFGEDITVVNAARVSFAKESVEMKPQDTKLINYLADHGHITPFFHPQVRLRLKMPIFVAREWYRHTVGFARNEVSRRYVDEKPECWMPIPGDLRQRDTNKKQGSKATAVENEVDLLEKIKDFQALSMDLYQALLDNEVAPEIARGVLPQSMYTEFIETGSLYAYARLCRLRCDPQAQLEIRVYAEALSVEMEKAFPVSWAALKKEWSGAPGGE